jgi:hypothetical protein
MILSENPENRQWGGACGSADFSESPPAPFKVFIIQPPMRRKISLPDTAKQPKRGFPALSV